MSISVVIPARNEELWLPQCLESLMGQDSAPDEIIVVDNGSTDDTAGVARAYGCKVLREPTPGVGRARFTGCQKASSEILAVTDADTRVPREWTAKILAVFAKEPRTVAITGPWSLFDGSTLARWSTALHTKAGLRAAALLAPATVNLVGCNGAFRAEAYEQVGGFRPDLKRGEDLNLSLRLRAVGHVRYVPDLAVRTSGRRFKKSFVGGLGQYLPDATRQVMSYLAGRREGPQASYAPAAFAGGAAAWMALDASGLLDLDMEVEPGMIQATPGIPALAGHPNPMAFHDLYEEI